VNQVPEQDHNLERKIISALMLTVSRRRKTSCCRSSRPIQQIWSS